MAKAERREGKHHSIQGTDIFLLEGDKTMPRRALVLIDIQNDYFPGGRWALAEIESAADNAAWVLAAAPSCRWSTTG